MLLAFVFIFIGITFYQEHKTERGVATGEGAIDHTILVRQFLIRFGAASARRNGRSNESKPSLSRRPLGA